jgi:outer membrane protein insertion porin family
MVRRTLAAIAISILLGASAAAAADDAAIVVAGNHRLGADSIKAYFHASENGRLTDADLDAALKAMYRSGEFSKVAIRRDGAAIRVTIDENPVIARLVFEGNRKLSDDKLKQLLQSRKDGPLSKPTVQEDVERLLEAYHRSGRFNAEIRPQTIGQANGRVDLVFEIKEGERVGIRQIVFTGNNAFGARVLKDAIKSGETNVLSFLLDNDLYDADKVEADRAQLLRFYRARGYVDASVRSAITTYDPDQKSFVLNFTIAEGVQYRLRTVTIDSVLRDVNGDGLRGLLRTRDGDIYNADAVESGADAMSKDIAKQGKPFVDVRPQLMQSTDGHVIDVVYRVEQGAPLYVERIEIHGNTTTRDNVIRREIEIGEGDAYNRALIDAAEARLTKLGYFKTVKLTKKPGSSPDRIVLDVAIEEQNTGNFSVSGGYSDRDGWLGEVSISDRNMFGRGEIGKLSVSYGQYSKGFDVGFTEPYIFGQRVSLGVDLFGKQTDSSSYQSYSNTVYGASVTVGTPISDTTALSWIYSIRNQSVTLDPTRGISSIPVQEAAAAGPQWVSTIGSGLTYDTLNSERSPSSGFKVRVNNDLAGLGGDVRFARNTDDLRFYHELPGDIVGVVHAQTGYITPWGGQSLPLLDGFFGGPQLVRGFASNGFGPRDLTPGTTNDNLGGNAFWATSYELQSSIPFVPQSVGLKAAVFADAGSLWGTGASKYSPALSSSLIGNSRSARSSVGVGLVWDSILGPLRLDYAYPLSKTSYDVTQRVHFGYGGF